MNSNHNHNTTSLPPSISTPNDGAGNELPTPPSVPLCDPPAFPATQQTHKKNRALPPHTTNNYMTTAPPPHPHYNKYYPYHHPMPPNTMYPYSIPNNYHYASYGPSYPRPPVSYRPPNPINHPPNPINPYPTFNGITPKPQTPPVVSISSSNTQNTTPNASQSISNRTSPKTRKKTKSTPPKIKPTYRPFYEQIETNNKDKFETETENDSETDLNENDSDYDPNTLNERNPKKKSKKTKKKKKQNKKKKKKIECQENVLYLASQKIYVTEKEGSTLTKSLTWKEFRDWLKYNLEPFDHQNWNKTRQRELFSMKMNKLLSFCTKIEIENGGHRELFYSLWLQIPQKKGKWIQLLISDGGWFTNCTSEQQMMGYVSKMGSKDYWFFRVLEGQRCSGNIVLLLRCDKGGNCGELVWLQKGQNVSGTDALAIENALSCALDLKWVYLHDDSKIKYGGNSSRSTCHLYLKTIRSIAKGQSWYAQALYRPFNCTNWPSQTNLDGETQTGVSFGTVFTQNAQEYKRAVHLIRNYPIKRLRKELILNTDFSKCGDKSDLKKLDEVLISMNEYDPYFELNGKESILRDLNDANSVNPSYFISFSSDSDSDIASVTSLDCAPTSLRRSKRDCGSLSSFERDRKLLSNSSICSVYRWHKRRICIKCNKLDKSSSVVGVCFYRRCCHSVGDIASVLYHEGNPESWGHKKSHGLKLLRCAKENLIKFFQHILTSAESKDLNCIKSQEFKRFHCALKCIEDTKIFGKRSKRWAQKQRQQKIIKKKSQSTEPLYDVVIERERLRQRQLYYHHQYQLYYRPQYQYNRVRNELFGDAQKLKLKEIEEKKNLYQKKIALQKDLDSHLIPNTKHKLLFESLKGKTNIININMPDNVQSNANNKKLSGNKRPLHAKQINNDNKRMKLPPQIGFDPQRMQKTPFHENLQREKTNNRQEDNNNDNNSNWNKRNET